MAVAHSLAGRLASSASSAALSRKHVAVQHDDLINQQRLRGGIALAALLRMMRASFRASPSIFRHHAAAHHRLRDGAHHALRDYGWGFDGAQPEPRIPCQARYLRDLRMNVPGLPLSSDQWLTLRQPLYEETVEAITDATTFSVTHPEYCPLLLAAAPGLDPMFVLARPRFGTSGSAAPT